MIKIKIAYVSLDPEERQSFKLRSKRDYMNTAKENKQLCTKLTENNFSIFLCSFILPS
jgi:hypothetical protein